MLTLHIFGQNNTMYDMAYSKEVIKAHSISPHFPTKNTYLEVMGTNLKKVKYFLFALIALLALIPA